MILFQLDIWLLQLRIPIVCHSARLSIHNLHVKLLCRVCQKRISAWFNIDENLNSIVSNKG